MLIYGPFSVDATPPDESVLCHGGENITQITIYEDNQAGTTDYKVKDKDGNGPITKPSGSKHTFYSSPGAPFKHNDVVGSISTATGSANFVQEES